MTCLDRRVDSGDLRMKLQKRHHGSQSGSGVRDLREKLSGTMNVQPISKVETARPSLKSLVTGTATETTRKTSSQATRKKSQQANMIHFSPTIKPFF